MTLEAEELAQRLNGREIGNEITADECELAKQHQLVVVFGYSDDMIEFRGAIHDEWGLPENGTFYIVNSRLIDEQQLQRDRETLAKYGHAMPDPIVVVATWDDPPDLDAPWLIDVANGHPFDIYEQGQLYCRGTVFKLETTHG